MLIYPAIDLMEGRCVRLSQGRFDNATRYGDPHEQLAAFAGAGAEWVHVVDLDGARAGRPVQRDLLQRLAGAGMAKIQCGGGVRSADDVSSLLDAGVARVVVGSAAAKRPDEVAAWLNRFGSERLCCAFDISIDAFEVAVDGWTASSGKTLSSALAPYAGTDLRHVLVTDVSRDGMMAGPNIDLVRSVTQTRPDLRVQASGGVTTICDLPRLRAAGAAGAIVGRALYENRFRLEDALAC